MKRLSRYRKAIAALVVPLAVYFGARYGLKLDAVQIAALTTVLTGAAVSQVPNGG